MSDESRTFRASRILSGVGTLVSGVYVGALARLARDHNESFLPMSPNEWGDFLAGTFAPMAFLWLVIGYFQQGEALRIQAKELREQVQGTKELAAHAGRQADVAERESRRSQEAVPIEPRFVHVEVSHKQGIYGGNLTITIRNDGLEARNIRLSSRVARAKLGLIPRATVGTGGVATLTVGGLGLSPHDFPFLFEMSYSDRDDNSYTAECVIIEAGEFQITSVQRHENSSSSRS